MRCPHSISVRRTRNIRPVRGMSLLAVPALAAILFAAPVAAAPEQQTPPGRPTATPMAALVPLRLLNRAGTGLIDTMTFPDTPVDRFSPQQSVFATNPNSAPVTLRKAWLGGQYAGEYSLSNPCNGVTLLPGQSCQLAVQFAPQVTGIRTASLVIDSSASPDQYQRVFLTGRGEGRR